MADYLVNLGREQRLDRLDFEDRVTIQRPSFWGPEQCLSSPLFQIAFTKLNDYPG
jgi:hypothetical protein